MISPAFEEIKAVWVLGLKVQPWWLRWKRTHLPFHRGVWRAFNNWCIPNLCSARISLEELNPSASKHPGLLPCVAIRVFPCTHSKITTPAAPSFSYALAAIPERGEVPPLHLQAPSAGSDGDDGGDGTSAWTPTLSIQPPPPSWVAAAQSAEKEFKGRSSSPRGPAVINNVFIRDSDKHAVLEESLLRSVHK